RRHSLPTSAFFFQAEDGIRDLIVTGVQTCALPIYNRSNISKIARLAPRSWRRCLERLSQGHSVGTSLLYAYARQSLADRVVTIRVSREQRCTRYSPSMTASASDKPSEPPSDLKGTRSSRRRPVVARSSASPLILRVQHSWTCASLTSRDWTYCGAC